ncbi:hypothetical protein EVAR_32228_1 [Eumeta japonica]|uniref:Uncharacterized protein n=1 Tax=Eumeta variegata TaxID=151549 RepID=A0A4C1YNL0_EUMVA|nr:hypothetical protein EVAR_32228_1 [Eumeta japonica]
MFSDQQPVSLYDRQYRPPSYVIRDGDSKGMRASAGRMLRKMANASLFCVLSQTYWMSRVSQNTNRPPGVWIPLPDVTYRQVGKQPIPFAC